MTSTLVVDLNALRCVVEDVGLDALLDELIDRLDKAFSNHDPEQTLTMVRAGFSYDQPDFGLVEWMPAMDRGRQVAVKTVAYHPSNPSERRAPSVLASTSLYSAIDGRLTSLCEATFLTALRTGAASALATDILAVKDASVIAMIGCGAQAVTQLHAISRVRPLAHAVVYDCDPAVSATLRARLPSSVDLEIRVVDVDALPEMVAEADVICTATSNAIAAPPVMPDSPIKPWLHINAIGSDFPGKIEVPVTLLRRATVCPDDVEQCLVEGEAQQLSREELGPDLATLVANPVDHERLRRELTVFDSTGWAVEDLVAAEVLSEHCCRLGLGLKVDLQPSPTDPYDPYEVIRS